MRKGFTLVELSIVLVIIGLIAGGILIANSMVQTARIQSQVKQFQQFDIAVTTFKQRYKQIPGDCNQCGAGQIAGIFAGNNNGVLDSNWRYTGPYEAMWVEPYFFFIHMSILGVLPESNFVYNSNSVLWGKGKQIPAAAIGRGGVMAIGNSLGDLYYTFMSVGNSAGATDYATIMPYGNMSPSEALALDTKLDNALPGSGIIAATTNLYAGDNIQIPLALDVAPGGCVNPVTGRYNVSNSSVKACMIAVKSDFVK